MFLLDTNVISELRAGKAQHSAAVRFWAAGIRADHLYVSTVSILELETGVLAMERKDVDQGEYFGCGSTASFPHFFIGRCLSAAGPLSYAQQCRSQTGSHSAMP